MLYTYCSMPHPRHSTCDSSMSHRPQGGGGGGGGGEGGHLIIVAVYIAWLCQLEGSATTTVALPGQEKLDKKDAEIESLKAKIAIQSIRLSSTPPPTEDQATTTYAITRARMQYWPEPSKTRKLVPLRPGHFVTLEVDHGGFNNIRMGMEMAAAVAMHLGRTLVMPEAKPWCVPQPTFPTHSRVRCRSVATTHPASLQVALHWQLPNIMNALYQ